MTMLILELALVVLLLIACAMGFVLNRRLHQLRRDQTNLLQSIETFDAATRRAETTLAAIKARGDTLDGALGRTVSRANFLMDELSVMVSAGDKIADRIEHVMADVRSVGRPVGRGLSADQGGGHG
ncbi:MAG: DUF6468 domain-containing protein [Pseudomonadota bacterium]